MSGHLAHGPANRGRRVAETAAPLFVCEPPRSPRGGVVVVHGTFGLTHDVEALCRRLGADGWLAVAPFLYHQHGGPVFGEPASAGAAAPPATRRAEVSALSPAVVGADIAAAVFYLAGRGCLDAAIIGLGTGENGFTALADLAGVGDVPLLELAGVPAADDSWRRIGSFLSEVSPG